MHFNVKSLKNKHTKKTKFVFKTHASGDAGDSTGDLGIDLYAKIWKPTLFIYLEKKDPFIYLKSSNILLSDAC